MLFGTGAEGDKVVFVHDSVPLGQKKIYVLFCFFIEPSNSAVIRKQSMGCLPYICTEVLTDFNDGPLFT